LRLCVMAAEEASHQPVGGRDIEVECDETEIGRRQKGIHGHKKIVKGDVWGAVERDTGRVILEIYDKMKVQEVVERRFGPPRADELEDLCREHIKPKTVLFTDGARAYEVIAKKVGYLHDYVDHSSGVYSKKATVGGQLRSVHTNTIDGLWGRLHCWWNNRGGVMEHLHYEVLKEFQWRQNLGDRDPFLALLEAIKEGHFPN